MFLKAVSKINLFLRIAGKRPDGYHEIETLFFPLTSPADTLEIELGGDGLSFSCNRPELEADDNLCVRAAKACFEGVRLNPSASVRLQKEIPIAAGMGGGSSDAAAVIRFFMERYPDLPDPEAIALKLGADVPFFLTPRPAVATGIGEKRSFPQDLHLPPILIVAPDFPVRAAWAYRNRAERACSEDARALPDLLDALRRKDWEKASRFLRNDLSHAIREKFPLIRLLERRLMEHGALGTQITGSGPTLFAVFPDEKARDLAKKEFPEYRVF